ncbi:hypothetical protein DdX_18668 [Ditylenchus destructor]|uniref:Uncharacterized protein n=1 Tax=Ditylenchus destructor TaxID=166010 RepID=A0AAD4MKS3_9BILA|nr:hypothetical protein DdX_18668 [Ditylenchus destructor]
MYFKLFFLLSALALICQVSADPKDECLPENDSCPEGKECKLLTGCITRRKRDEKYERCAYKCLEKFNSNILLPADG